MKIQEIVSDVRSRVETAGKQYQGAFKAYIDTQRKAVGIVTKNSQTLANTEIGAAKNVFAAAKASFDKARNDGVRKVARNPQTYVPNGRDQIVSAYKDTIDLLVRTGNELTVVVSTGYKSVLDVLAGTPTKKDAKTTTTRKKSAPAKSASSTTAKKSTTAAKRKTASTRKSTTGTAKAPKSTAAKSTSTARKRTASPKTASKASTTATSTSAANGSDSDSSATS